MYVHSKVALPLSSGSNVLDHQSQALDNFRTYENSLLGTDPIEKKQNSGQNWSCKKVYEREEEGKQKVRQFSREGTKEKGEKSCEICMVNDAELMDTAHKAGEI